MTPPTADNQVFHIGNDLVDVLMDLLDTELTWQIMGWALDFYARTGRAAYLRDLRSECPQWAQQVEAV